MKKSQFSHLFEQLESLKRDVERVEFWSARDLQEVFGYSKWQNFEILVKKAATACKNSNVKVEDQFTAVSKLIQHGKGGEREVRDYALTQYACI